MWFTVIGHFDSILNLALFVLRKLHHAESRTAAESDV